MMQYTTQNSDLIARRVHFDFPEDINLYAVPSKPELSLYLAAFSLMLPDVERYLIKTMVRTKRHVSDENLMQDLQQFCKQEGNHYSSHQRINNIIINQFDTRHAYELRKILDDIHRD